MPCSFGQESKGVSLRSQSGGLGGKLGVFLVFLTFGEAVEVKLFLSLISGVNDTVFVDVDVGELGLERY